MFIVWLKVGNSIIISRNGIQLYQETRATGTHSPDTHTYTPGEGRRNSHLMSDVCCLPGPTVASLHALKPPMMDTVCPLHMEDCRQKWNERAVGRLCVLICPYSNTCVHRKHTFAYMHVLYFIQRHLSWMPPLSNPHIISDLKNDSIYVPSQHHSFCAFLFSLMFLLIRYFLCWIGNSWKNNGAKMAISFIS